MRDNKEGSGKAKRSITISLTGDAPKLDRLLVILEEVLHRFSDSDAPPRNQAPADGVDNDGARQALWTRLTPDQRSLLKFAWRHECTGLTYSAISSYSEFPIGLQIDSPGTFGGRKMSDKSIRKCCEALFEEELLVRASRRGAISLSPLAHDLIGWAKTQGK